MRKVAGLLFATAVFVLNPAFMCGPDFTYSAKELNAAIAGTWKLTYNDWSITFRMEQAKAEEQHSSAGFVSDAAACSNRTLVASASACIDSTRMPLKLIALDGSTKKMKGELAVHGKDFKAGQLKLSIDAAEFEFMVDPQGNVEDFARTGIELVHTR